MPASKAQQAKTAKRRTEAIKLKLAGVDYDTIAERLNYASRQAATKDMCRALKQYRKEEGEKVAQWRTLEGRRLDRLQAAAWTAAVKGDLKAIETVLKIINQRARLFGLDAPVKIESEASGPGGSPLQMSDASIHQLHLLIGMAGEPDAGDGDEDPGYEGEKYQDEEPESGVEDADSDDA